MNKKPLIYIAIIAVVIVLGYFTYTSKIALSPDTPIDEVSTTTNSVSSNSGNGAGTTVEGGISGEEAGYTSGGSSTEVVTPPPQEVFNRVVTTTEPNKKRIAELTVELKANPNDLDNWLELGVLYKIAKDYEGAKIAWEYVSTIRPKNTSSFTNLGDLYHYYLKDFPKSEKALLTVIKNDPKMVEGYMRLFDLYTISYKTETTLGADILKQGIDKNPDAVQLMITLGDYYRTKGANELAKMSYEKALVVAKKANNTAQVNEINSLISKLQ